jgi:hypothetical protein
MHLGAVNKTGGDTALIDCDRGDYPASGQERPKKSEGANVQVLTGAISSSRIPGCTHGP